MKIGDLIEGKYELVRTIGRGAMGSVWEAKHKRLGRRVALKFLHKEMSNDQEAVDRFIREAQAASSLGHDYIADVTDVGHTGAGGTHFLVMELLEGLTLAQLLRRDGNLEPMRAARLVRQLCKALHAAHQRGIVHRDVKPDNIFVIVRDDGTEQIKVLDFGIAKFRAALAGEKSATLTATGVTLGTPYYMAPEQARAAKNLDGRTDVYSAGVVLYELLTGKPPFSGGSFSAVVIEAATNPPPSLSTQRPDLPAGYEDVVLKAMARKRRDRFGSADDMANALAPFAGLTAAATTAPVVIGTEPTMPPTPAAPPTAAIKALTGDLHLDDEARPSALEGTEARQSQATVPPDTAVVSKSEVAAAAAAVAAASSASPPDPSSDVGVEGSVQMTSEPQDSGRSVSRIWVIFGMGSMAALIVVLLGALVCGGVMYHRGVQAGAAARDQQKTTEGNLAPPPPPLNPASPATGPAIGIGAGNSNTGVGDTLTKIPEGQVTPPGNAGPPLIPPMVPSKADPGNGEEGTISAVKAVALARRAHNQRRYDRCIEVLDKARHQSPAVSMWRAKCLKGQGNRTEACITALSCRQHHPCFKLIEQYKCLQLAGDRAKELRGKR